MQTATTQKQTVNELITARILDSLNKGIIPWRKPWTIEMPQNFVTGRKYRGINALLTMMNDFTSNSYMTFKQIKEKSLSVTKGSVATPIVFYSFYYIDKDGTIIKEADYSAAKYPLATKKGSLRYYSVFNTEQCTGLQLHPEPPTDTSDDLCDVVIGCIDMLIEQNRLPQYTTKGKIAGYSPDGDYVVIPKPHSFKTKEAYIATLFHEMIHATGHQSRLAREGVTSGAHFGDCDYSFEELVAELGSCFLSAHFGIDTSESFTNSTAYLQGWVKSFEQKPDMLIKAAAQAQKAVDYILGTTPSHEE